MSGTGSQDLLSRTLEHLVGPGDTVLIERPTYSAVLSILRATSCQITDVAADKDGLIPESLEAVLKKAARKPKALYTISNGNNPTGASLTSEKSTYCMQHRQAHKCQTVSLQAHAREESTSWRKSTTS